VRQSSAHQVLHNPEGRALRYAMRDRRWCINRKRGFRTLAAVA
jgi:ribosomal protein L20